MVICYNRSGGNGGLYVCACACIINSLAPGRFQSNLWKLILKLILVIDGCDISSEITLRWTSQDLSDDKSTLGQVMAWYRQVTSYYQPMLT